MAYAPAYTGPMRHAQDYRQSHENSLPAVQPGNPRPGSFASKAQLMAAEQDPMYYSLVVKPQLQLGVPVLDRRSTYLYERRDRPTYPYPFD
jgi:hypothetical protein